MSKTKSRCYLACFQGWHHIHNDKYEYMGSDCGDCISQKAYIQAIGNAKLNQRPCGEELTEPLLPVVRSQGPKESISSLLLPSPFTLFVRMLFYFLVEMGRDK